MFKLKETRLNVHMTHIEDLVLFGPSGISELNDKISKFIKFLETGNSDLNISQKIDGAPAVICWHKLAGYPDDSICLKSFVNGAKNSLSTYEDVEDRYGDRPDMAIKLKYCLDLAKCIPDNEAWQGDCLYSRNDLARRSINNKEYLTFHPNKIIYAISEDNPSYDKIVNSKFGICFHTRYLYRGGKLEQDFKIDVSSISVQKDFYIMSPTINVPNEKEYNLDEINNKFEELKSVENRLTSSSEYEELINNTHFMSYWNTFENSNLADKKSVNLSVISIIDDLSDYISNKLEAELQKKISNLKTEAGIEKAKKKYSEDLDSLIGIIKRRSGVITDIVKAINLAADIKMDMLAGLNKADVGYDAFYQSITRGYIKAQPEGIALSDQDGNIVKLIDRSTFSNANRDPDIISGFDHSESLMKNEGVEFKTCRSCGKLYPITQRDFSAYPLSGRICQDCFNSLEETEQEEALAYDNEENDI